MRFRVLPYSMRSRSAKELAVALEGLRLLTYGSRFVPREDDVLINWGNSAGIPNVGSANFLNHPDEIESVANKLQFFHRMWWSAPDIVPPWWTSTPSIPDEAFPIVCRTVLNGNSGNGIVIADTREELVHASLYTQLIPKTAEYRIHVGKIGDRFPQIIGVQQKVRRDDPPEPKMDLRVQNHSNGFVFKRFEIKAPVAVLDAARRALQATDLDFGAMDVVWDGNKKRAYVLEVNTAPGVQGTTVKDYVRFFNKVGSANKEER